MCLCNSEFHARAIFRHSRSYIIFLLPKSKFLKDRWKKSSYCCFSIPPIFKLRPENLKLSDIFKTCCSPITELEANILNMTNRSFQNVSFLIFDPIRCGEGRGERDKNAHVFSEFSPVTSTNVGISPKSFLTFSFNPFVTLV